ncbi:MAG: TatD family hydrolase [Acidobacteria bacterium]|nr:TatD family hydrolase [Acidobacteriota bacterium]
MFIDSHAHLDASEFDGDRQAVIDRARSAGMEAVLEICGSFPEAGSFEIGLKLVEQYEFIYGAIGIHPHDAKIYNDRWEADLREWSTRPGMIGWGEIGLDYHYDHSPREVQRAVFTRQLALARERRLPIIVHSREAEEDTLAILRDEWPRELPGVMHCFTGTARMAEAAVESGFYISFSGVITFKNAGPLRELACGLPFERVLIETDSPFLAPVPHRGKRNEPVFVMEVARQLGELRGIAEEEVARITADNFRALFRLP